MPRTFKPWKQVFVEARERGCFTPQEMNRADGWISCAVGEHLSTRNGPSQSKKFSVFDKKISHQLDKLGTRFAWLITHNHESEFNLKTHKYEYFVRPNQKCLKSINDTEKCYDKIHELFEKHYPKTELQVMVPPAVYGALNGMPVEEKVVVEVKK